MPTIGQQSRDESYESELPVIPGKRQVVLDAVRGFGSHGATREEIAERTGLKLSSVCGRVNELLASGHLNEAEFRRQSSSGKMVSVVVVNGTVRQLDLF